MADPILTDHQVKTLKDQTTFVVRVRVPMDQLDLAALFAVHLPRLQTVAGDGGHPYGRYHEFGPTHADVEIGIPLGTVSHDLPQPKDGEEPIQLSELPGGPTAIVTHHGGYETLGAAYDRFQDWIQSQGYETGPGPWESYLDLPGQVGDVASLRTVLHWPLVEG
jgi:effector-binding domain-containing protein